MNNVFKKIEMFVVVVIIAGIGIVYAFKQKPATTPPVAQNKLSANSAGSPKNDLNQQAPETTIIYSGQDGRNALDLLKVNHQVESKHYDFGDLVVSIDGIIPDTAHFWAMYVNGEMSQVGASAYVTKSSDSIKWQIDAISAE